MKEKCVRGCKELHDYFKSTDVNYLSGHDVDCFYYRLEGGTWDYIPSYRFDEDKWKWEVVTLNEYLRQSSLSKTESTSNNNSKLKDVLNIQIGGSHYQGSAIQPIEYIMANKLNFSEGCVVKYISRHRKKNGKEDLLKVIQNVQMILADEYGVVVEFKVKED